MTPLGKDRIAKEARRIAEIIALKIVTSGETDDGYESVMFWTRRSLVQDEDAAFSSDVAQYLSRELCSLYQGLGKQQIRQKIAEAFLISFVSSLLDVSRFDLLPTCNFTKMQENSGDDVLEQSMMLLDLFNDTSGHGSTEWMEAHQRQIQNREKAFEAWHFADSIRTLFSTAGQSSYGLICSKLSIPDSCLEISIESEALQTYSAVQKLITVAKETGDSVTFEELSSLVLALMSKSVLRVIEGIQYNEQHKPSNDNDKEHRFRLAKLNECLVCFLELFIGGAAWILLESSGSLSTTFSSLLKTLRDNFFVPVLRRQETVDVTTFLRTTLLATDNVLNRNGPNVLSSSSSLFMARSVFANNIFGLDVFYSVLRRSRQFVLSSYLNEQNKTLQMALIDAVLKSEQADEASIAHVVGASMGTNWQQPLRHFSCISPLQEDVDDYLATIDNRFVTDSAENSLHPIQLSEGKILFLQTYVLPSLTHAQTALDKKRKLLQLLASSLSFGATAERDSLSSDFICNALRAISTTVFQALVCTHPDNNLIAAAFVCAQHLSTTFVTVASHPNEVQTVISHSFSELKESNGKSLLELTSSEISGAYIWCFFQWVYGLAKMIVKASAMTDDGTSSSELAKVQELWREDGIDSRVGGIDEEALDFFTLSKSFETWDRLLIDLGGILYPTMGSQGKPATMNVYQKHRSNKGQILPLQTDSQSGVGTYNQFPSVGAKREAKELMAAIVSSM
jgi:hypothetical protein